MLVIFQDKNHDMHLFDSELRLSYKLLKYFRCQTYLRCTQLWEVSLEKLTFWFEIPSGFWTEHSHFKINNTNNIDKLLLFYPLGLYFLE